MTVPRAAPGASRPGVVAAALTLAVALFVLAVPVARAAYDPGPARYGVGERSNVGVTMRDGTVLRADVYYPTVKGTGSRAPGRFPVLLIQSPYGKDAGLGAAGEQLAGAFPYAVERGYINVVADVRGAGDSHGSWGLFDPVQAHDGAQLVRWAAGLSHSSGKVGLYGESYLGIDQLLTAGALGRHSPLKAIFPVVVANDIYRDTAFFGGVADLEFDAAFLALTAGLHLVNPPVETLRASDPQPSDTLQVELEHLGGVLGYHAGTVASVELGGRQGYDGPYWRSRNPRNVLRRVVRNHIAAFLVGGWYDLFQRGTPLDYSGLQNAWAGRPVGAPMAPGQPVTGRYQLMDGPWYHVTAPGGIDLEAVQLAWFDHWLKGRPTGIARTPTPMHLYTLGSGDWVNATRYPLDQARPTTLYLGGGPSGSGAPSRNDGRLTDSPPSANSGADTVAFVPVTSPCDRQTEQWGAGGGALALGTLGLADPCTNDDRTLEAGPGSLTYTSAPFAADRVVAGPIDATIYASSTRPETFFEVTLEDVKPNGSATPLTSGGLLGSFRALDADRSWLAGDGNPILPYHPYTRSSSSPVVPGKVSRYDVEVFPTFARIPAGDRLRVTITTGDTPHLGFTPQELAQLAGGVYAVERNSGAASFVEVPLARPDSVATPCDVCTPTG